MTTIAWDGKTLAVDSYVNQGDIITDKDGIKIFYDVGDYHAAAIAGLLIPLGDFVEWLKGEKEKDHPKADGEIVVVDSNGDAYSFFPDDSHNPTQRRMSPYATGSGRKLAIGAMEAGATAIEAIEIAARRDPFTGGKVRFYTFDKCQNST